MGDDYQPREHDHLVEPVFGGLGVEPRPATPRGLLGRLRAWCAGLVRLLTRARSSRRGER